MNKIFATTALALAMSAIAIAPSFAQTHAPAGRMMGMAGESQSNQNVSRPAKQMSPVSAAFHRGARLDREPRDASLLLVLSARGIPMPGIKIVLHLVSCATNLLICDDLDTSRLAFEDVAHCEQQRPDHIGIAQKQLGSSVVIMGRCRFLLGRETPGIPAPAQHHSRHRLAGSPTDPSTK